MKQFFLIIISLSLLLHADFSRNSEGIVIDNTTGLMWQDSYSNNTLKKTNWEDSIEYCESLTLGGNNDWRLPNKKELSSIIDYEKYNPSIDLVFQKTCLEDTCYYWSSTTNIDETTYAWYVDFWAGYIGIMIKSENLYVRCVRN